MESVKSNFLANTWKRCRRSFPRNIRGGKSCNGEETRKKKKKKTTPEAGFVPVYVGAGKERFVVRTEYVNHPLFTMLLEDAEMEYGYKCEGPIWLPCDVDLFYKVLAEMEAEDDVQKTQIGWTTSFAYGSCSPFNPGRRLGTNGADQMGKGYGYYESLTSCKRDVLG